MLSNSPLLSPGPNNQNYNILGWPETRYQDTPSTYNCRLAEVAYFFLAASQDTARMVRLYSLCIVANGLQFLSSVMVTARSNTIMPLRMLAVRPVITSTLSKYELRSSLEVSNNNNPPEWYHLFQ